MAENQNNTEIVETISFCGFNWDKIPGGHELKSSVSDFHVYDGYLANNKIGYLFITGNAFKVLNDNEALHYKVISLIYDLCSSNKLIFIRQNEEDIPKKLPVNDDYIVLTVDAFIKKFPANIIEIQHRSLLTLYNNYPNYGQQIKTIENFHFFASDDVELGFILNSLIAKNYLEGSISWHGDGTMHLKGPFKIAVDGWVEIEKSIHSIYSNRVFIAMSFDESLMPVRDSIKNAIRDAGFDPIVADEVEHIKYIPLEIQNLIKNCSLIVADFTTQNHGVYFEAGYAMGQNIPVVWCCRNDDKRNLHFDINQYNNILWNDENELYNRLKKRLIALKGISDK